MRLLSVWMPLNDVTLHNGCMYAVPRAKDADFAAPGGRAATALHEPVVPVDGLTPLAPRRAGSLLCWSGNTIHWGSACEPGRAKVFGQHTVPPEGTSHLCYKRKLG